MSLFGKKNEKTKENGEIRAEALKEKLSSGACSIKVLGPGCKNCHALYEHAQAAAKAAGLNAEIEYVTDLQKITEYGVMSMPALVVNEKVVSSGKVLGEKEIVQLLAKP